MLIAAPLSIASAADMPLKALPPAPVYNWTGCYISGGVGYGMWNEDHYTETFPAPILHWNKAAPAVAEAGLAGSAGCDYQFNAFNSNFVVGVLGDYDFMGLSGSFGDPFLYVIGNENESAAWYVGGRIGYLVTPTLLTYFDGGYTQTRFDQINLSYAGAALGFSTAPFNIPATTFNGWFPGGGTEYALTWLPISGLFWRNEYRFASYEAQDIPLLSNSTGVVTGCLVRALDPGCGEHVQTYVQTITTSLVWRFNFGQ